eukprot:scaffold4049_cov204-Alexandrium_tamarense.AAC.32
MKDCFVGKASRVRSEAVCPDPVPSCVRAKNLLTPSITVNAPSSLRRFSDGARYVLQMSRDGGEGSPPTRQLMSPAVASDGITISKTKDGTYHNADAKDIIAGEHRTWSGVKGYNAHMGTHAPVVVVRGRAEQSRFNV